MNHHILASLFELQESHRLLFVGIILLLYGAKKIPELARGLGKSMNEFKRARKEYDDEDDRT